MLVFWMAWDVAGRGCGAANRIRTCDPVITNDVLYQLSYCGGPLAALGKGFKTPAPDIGHRPALQEKHGPFGARISSPSGTGSSASRRPGLSADPLVPRTHR